MKTLLLISMLAACAGCNPKTFTPATFTPRVIANDDGTYTTEYYFPYPGYQTDPNAFHVTLEEANKAAKKWSEIATNKQPTIVTQ